MNAPASVKQAFQFLAILFAAMLLWHGSLIAGGSVLSGGDMVNHAAPIREAQLARGWFAGWQPESFSGRPLIDDPQSGTFYPPNLIHVLGLSAERGITLLILIHLALGGFGFYLLARVKFRFEPATLAGLLWAFGSYHLMRMSNGIVVFSYAFAWLPWMWLAAERQSLRRQGAIAWVAVLAMCGACQLLAGAPQVSQITWFGLGLWTLGRIVQRAEGDRPVAVAGGFALAGLLALAACAPYLAGVVRFMAEGMPREEGSLWSFVSDGSLRPRLLMLFLVPEFFGPGNDEALYWGSSMSFTESSGFFGIAPLTLCAIAVACGAASLPRRRDRWAISLTLLSVLGLLISLGGFGPLFGLLVAVVPTFDMFRVPARWLVWPVMGGILGAAWCLNLLLENSESPDRRRVWAGAAGMALVLVGLSLARILTPALLDGFGLGGIIASRFPDPTDTGGVALESAARAGAEWSLLLAAATAAAVAAVVARKIPSRVGVAMVLVLTLADLFRFWLPFSARIPEGASPSEIESEASFSAIAAADYRQYFFPESPTVQALRRLPGRGRIHYDDSLSSHAFDQEQRELLWERPVALGLEITRGYQPMILGSYAQEYYASMIPLSDVRTGAFLSQAEIRDRRFLDAYNVTHMLGYELDFLAKEIAEAGLVDPEPIGPVVEGMRLMLWRNPHARGWAWLSREEQFLEAVPDVTLGSVALEKREADMWMGRVAASEPCYLHISSPDYSGWRISLSGESGASAGPPATSRTIRIPAAGEWRFERRFHREALRPRWIAISLASFVAMACCFVVGRRRSAPAP